MREYGLAGDEVRAHFRWQESIVRDVVTRYLREHRCPCDWPQFEYWASKPQGPGWHDEIQNNLVDLAGKLECFETAEDLSSGFTAAARLDCRACSRQWRLECEEWRMLAYRKKLVPSRPSGTAPLFEPMVDRNFFATSGQEPAEHRCITIVEWAQFMLGVAYEPPPLPVIESEAPHRTPERISGGPPSQRRPVDIRRRGTSARRAILIVAALSGLLVAWTSHYATERLVTPSSGEYLEWLQNGPKAQSWRAMDAQRQAESNRLAMIPLEEQVVWMPTNGGQAAFLGHASMGGAKNAEVFALRAGCVVRYGILAVVPNVANSTYSLEVVKYGYDAPPVGAWARILEVAGLECAEMDSTQGSLEQLVRRWVNIPRHTRLLEQVGTMTFSGEVRFRQGWVRLTPAHAESGQQPSPCLQANEERERVHEEQV